MSNMESHKNVDLLNFAKHELEAQAKKIQEKLGGCESRSVLTFQIVLPSAIGKNTEQKIASLESEVENLKKSLEDCEDSLESANKDTYKSNKLARDTKAKNAELEARVKDFETEVQIAGDKAAQLEIAFKEAEEKYVGFESKIRQYESKFIQLKQTTTKYEREVESVRSELQQKEMKVEDLSQQLSDKLATLERKEVKIGYLSEKADQFKSRATLSEQKVSDLESRTRELELRAVAAESKCVDAGEAKKKFETSVYEYKEELKKTVSKSHFIAEALSNEKRKTAALESEVTDLKKKSRDANSGHAKVLARRITELEKVIDVTKEQAQDEISSLVSKKEASEKRLITELETIKSKVAAGDRVASELKEKKAKLAEMEHELKIYGDRLADSDTKFKNLSHERDEAVKKADAAYSKVKTLSASIAEYESEIQTVKKRSVSLVEQLRKVGVKIEEHKSTIKGREESAHKKAEMARQLLEEIKQSELEIERDETELVNSVETYSETVESYLSETTKSSKSKSAVANGISKSSFKREDDVLEIELDSSSRLVYN